jgi:hypothetical protein
MLNVEDKFSGQMMQCPLCGGTFTAPMLAATVGSGPSAAVPLAAPVGHQSSPSKEDVFSLAPTSDPSPRNDDRGEKVKDQKTNKRSEEAVVPPSSILNEPSDSVADAASPTGEYPHRYIIWISPRVVPWIAPVSLSLVFFLLFFYWRSVPSGVTGETGSQIGLGRLFSGPLWILYFLSYLLALPLAIGSLLLTLKVVPVPHQIKHLIPWKAVIVASVVALAFLLILLNCLLEDFGTVWMRSAVWLHFAALIGLALEFWLQRRGPARPMPRIDVLW